MPKQVLLVQGGGEGTLRHGAIHQLNNDMSEVVADVRRLG